MIHKRYLFENKEQAEKKVFSNTNIKASFIWLDKFVKVEGKYNKKGKEIVAPVFTENYALDIVWHNLDKSPYGWKSYEIEPKNPKHRIL
jgi:hypothetical protein